MAILLVCWCVLSGMGGTDAQDNNASRAPFPCVVAGGRSRSALQSVSLTTVMARPEASSRIPPQERHRHDAQPRSSD